MVNWCCLCEKAEETCNYLLIRCPAVYGMWPMAYELLGVNWVMTHILKEEL